MTDAVSDGVSDGVSDEVSARLAALHAACFTHPRPWSAAAFAALLADPAVFLLEGPDRSGFILGRTVLDEAELLTLAVSMHARRRGAGTALLAAYHAEAQRRGARSSFLEVGSDNPAARALYARAGYAQVGLRPRYYGAATDALILKRHLGPDPLPAG